MGLGVGLAVTGAVVKSTLYNGMTQHICVVCVMSSSSVAPHDDVHVDVRHDVIM